MHAPPLVYAVHNTWRLGVRLETTNIHIFSAPWPILLAAPRNFPIELPAMCDGNELKG
jgi:hypothetical protein